MTVDPIEYPSGKTTLLAWVQADGTVVVGVKDEGDYGDGAPLKVTVSPTVLRQLADIADAARTRDLRAQLAEGAETLGRERALWIDAFAKQQAVVDAACSLVDDLDDEQEISGAEAGLIAAVAAYRATKGQG
jgi:hypothetical protein